MPEATLAGASPLLKNWKFESDMDIKLTVSIIAIT
jgi:hypothetical protein